MIQIIIGLVMVIGLGVGGLWVKHGWTKEGYVKRDLECKAEVSAINAEKEEAYRQGVALREKGRILADKLAAQTAEYKSQIESIKGRADREIAVSASRTQRAFDERLVRMLNELSPIRETVTRIDPPGSTTPGTDETVTTVTTHPVGPPGRGASVFSVATAISQCRSGYDACRVQLHALQDYVTSIVK